jgi:hypothetical protein
MNIRNWSLIRHHKKVADYSDTVSKAMKVTVGISLAGAYVAAPTGLTAVAVSVGLVSAPLLVTAAPLLASAATVAMTVSAAASLYSKYQSRQPAVPEDPPEE